MYNYQERKNINQGIVYETLSTLPEYCQEIAFLLNICIYIKKGKKTRRSKSLFSKFSVHRH